MKDIEVLRRATFRNEDTDNKVVLAIGKYTVEDARFSPVGAKFYVDFGNGELTLVNGFAKLLDK